MLLENNEIEKKDRLLIVFLKSISSNKSKKFNNLISDFDEQKTPYINNSRYKSRIKILKKLYFNTEYRHSYSVISSYLTSLKKEINLESVADNMGVILKKLLDTCEECSSKEDIDKNKYSEFLESVFKLTDHISLEAIRLNDLLSTEKNLIENTRKAEEKIEHKAISINKELEKSSKEIKSEINGELKKARAEYITILGIFAAIVLSFVAGLTFSTSVLSNIDKSSIYRLILIVCLIGFFITNILHYLYSFVREIHFGNSNQDKNVCNSFLGIIKNKFCNSYIFKFNIFVACIILSTFLCWYIFENSKNDLESNTKRIKSNNKLELYATEPLNILKSELK
ncbi:hypothetical protein [Aliarcobacter butzleri]|uniref:hypothetical protein n=1 Tax=Aliarcobacter butzleri TaxID=28197 RepID=UPI00062E4966|nr:hypothetical protein [Aliarcobacter butzleri]KLD99248.1 hypothetical protein AF74_00425 [Aliarcobacter butzleri L349]